MMKINTVLLCLVIIVPYHVFARKDAFFRPRKRAVNYELIQAAARDDVDKVCSLLAQKKVPLDLQDNEGRTALFRTSSSEITFQLILSGADLDKPDCRVVSPLLDALLRGNLEKAMVLVLAGASPNVSYENKTPLMLAAQQHDYELTKELAKAGAKISYAVIDIIKPYDSNCAHFLECFKQAKINRSLNTLGPDGLAHLHHVVLQDDPVSIDACIAAGAKKNMKTASGHTPLQVACRHKCKGSEKKLRMLNARY